MTTPTTHTDTEDDGYSWSEHQALLDKLQQLGALTAAEQSRLEELDQLMMNG